jgi:hypothetical protein
MEIVRPHMQHNMRSIYVTANMCKQSHVYVGQHGTIRNQPKPTSTSLLFSKEIKCKSHQQQNKKKTIFENTG